MLGKRNKENKKKGRKKKVIACVVTVAVLGTAGSIVYSKNRRPTDNKSEKGEAKSTEVTLGNISDTIIGTGNLELDEAQAVTIPSGLTVSEVYVESGDQVSAGTVLASVDKSSVLSAVKTVQEEIDELDEKISECQNDSTSNTESSQYSTDVTAFTVSPDENMCLSASVDELDINSVEKGQKAVVTFDAIEDKEFEGEVTEIGNSASVNGGVAKYTVEITIPKDDEMKVGMNAFATITTEERNQILTLPMNALQKQGDKTFVYTEKNTDGTLSGEVEIQTGMTDGNTVEITDGLEEGDTVYYMRSENSSSGSSADMQNKMPGGGQGGPGM